MICGDSDLDCRLPYYLLWRDILFAWLFFFFFYGRDISPDKRSFNLSHFEPAPRRERFSQTIKWRSWVAALLSRSSIIVPNESSSRIAVWMSLSAVQHCAQTRPNKWGVSSECSRCVCIISDDLIYTGKAMRVAILGPVILPVHAIRLLQRS